MIRFEFYKFVLEQNEVLDLLYFSWKYNFGNKELPSPITIIIVINKQQICMRDFRIE